MENQAIKNSNKLTVILVIKDRASYTFRWMSYANRINFPFKVLIADGGGDERVTKTLSNPSSFPKVDSKYLRYPYDKTYSEFYAKIAQTLAITQTPYAALADDDDFFVVEGLFRSIDFLEANPDYVSCRGQMGSVVVETTNGSILPDETYSVPKFAIFPAQASCKAKSAMERVKLHFSKYSPTWYNVHRTKELFASFQTLSDLNLKDILLAELLGSFLTITAGNEKRLSSPYLIRQVNVSESANSEFQRKTGDHFDRMLLESWSDDFTKTVLTLSAAISEKDKTSIENNLTEIKQSYRKYISPRIIQCLSDKKKTYDKSLSSAAKKVIKNLPSTHPLRLSVEKLYYLLFRTKRANVPVRLNKSSKYYANLKPIHEMFTQNSPKQNLPF